MAKTMVLLYENLLSCNFPICSNASVKTSVIAIGNKLRYPKGEFPAWVLEYERDPLFWTSGTDGMSLVLMISGAVGLLVFAVVSTLGSDGLLRAMSRLYALETDFKADLPRDKMHPFGSTTCIRIPPKCLSLI